MNLIPDPTLASLDLSRRFDVQFVRRGGAFRRFPTNSSLSTHHSSLARCSPPATQVAAKRIDPDSHRTEPDGHGPARRH